jgi:biopolymer transport protein ExbB
VASEARSSIGAIFAAILKKAGQPLPFVKEAAEEVGRQEAARLERFVGALGTVASITPLLGLLGTVTGMIGVFQRVAETGVGNPLDMAAGIWEALLTTAFGLGVGIPALLAHRFTLSRVDTLVLELEEEALRMAELAAGGWNDATPGED